jgi:hypothetical protein
MQNLTINSVKSRHFLKDSPHEHEKFLRSGEYLKAETKEILLIMQEDGNLCLYKSKTNNSQENCLWTSNTYKKGRAPYILVMQDDGNLVIYDADKKPTWST